MSLAEQSHGAATGSRSRNPLVQVRKALGRVRRSVAVDAYDFFVCQETEHAEKCLPPGYSMRFAKADDIRAADEYHTDLNQQERVEGLVRLGFGHRCVAIFQGFPGTEMVFSMWENPRNVNVPELVKRRLSNSQSFLYKAYTSPDHRGRKLYQAGLAFALQTIQREGKTEVTGYAHVKKKASRAGLARVGFQSIGRVRELNMPGVHRVWASRAFDRSFPQSVERTGAVAAALAGNGGEER